MICTGIALAVYLAQAGAPANEAASLFEKAREQMKSGQANEACPLFEKSYQLEPALGTLLNWAMCLESLGNLSEAYLHYNEASAWAARLKDHRREQWAFQRSQALKPRLSWLALSTVETTPGLRVQVGKDIHSLTTAPLVLPVNVVQVSLTVTAPDFHELKHTLTVKQEGETVTWQVPALTPKAPPMPAVTARLGEPVSSQPSSKGWSIAGLSSGLVLTAAGVVGLSWSYTTYSELQKQRADAGNVDGGSVTREEFARLQVIYPSSWAAVGVGAATTAVSAWFLLQKDKEKQTVTVLPAPGGVLLGFHQAF